MGTKLLQVCCMCDRVPDERATGERWITQASYRETTGIDPAVCLQTHTYCPDCYNRFMNHIRAA
jgi:hypothetical protein